MLEIKNNLFKANGNSESKKGNAILLGAGVGAGVGAAVGVAMGYNEALNEI